MLQGCLTGTWVQQDSKQEDTEELTPFLQKQGEHAELDEAGQDWG